ncbi:MAG: hypothetical protein PHH28_08460 [Desulfuromonadaceae bacterium]|nr:hypothetical protein [Desulfuromonadaceae bacterium]
MHSASNPSVLALFSARATVGSLNASQAVDGFKPTKEKMRFGGLGVKHLHRVYLYKGSGISGDHTAGYPGNSEYASA